MAGRRGGAYSSLELGTAGGDDVAGGGSSGGDGNGLAVDVEQSVDYAALAVEARNALRRYKLTAVAAAGAAVVLAIVLAAVVVTGHGSDAQAAAPNAAVVDPLEACGGRGMLEDSVCRCDACASGAACDTVVSDAECVVAASSGSPFMFEEYWHGLRSEQPAASVDTVVNIEPYYHIGYGGVVGAGGCGGFAPGADICVDLLEQEVRALHGAVGNFDPEGFHYIPAVGSTELISAAMYGYNLGTRIAVYSDVPFYSGYKSTSDFFGREWLQSAAEAATTASAGTSNASAHVLEFVTSPNNPDGTMRGSSVRGHTEGGATPAGTSLSVVWDSAYYWPHYTSIAGDRGASAQENDVVLFTLSKLTGHASSRVGWAFTRNHSIAESLKAYVGVNGGVSREAQLRASTILASERKRGYPVLSWARDTMHGRWETLEEILGATGNATCLELHPRDDESSPAYAWLRCTKAADCFSSLLQGAGITGRAGTQFGASSDYLRLELLMGSRDFDAMQRKLRTFVVEDGCAS